MKGLLVLSDFKNVIFLKGRFQWWFYYHIPVLWNSTQLVCLPCIWMCVYTHTIQMLIRLVLPGGSDGRVSACNAGDPGLGLPVYMYVYHSSNVT